MNHFLGKNLARTCVKSVGLKRAEEAFSNQQSANAKTGKKSAKIAVSQGMHDSAGKSFGNRLREWGCPDTLIKDVRDVAAAVLCSEGPGQSRNKGFESTEESGHLKQSR
jgi:hypothetical protein